MRSLYRWASAPATVLAVTLAARTALALDEADDAGWTRVAEAHGVVVYEARTSAHPLPVRRALGVIEASLPEVLGVLGDVERQVDWLPGCSEARVIMRESERVYYVYSRTDVPWPAADRDVVVRTETEVITPGMQILLRFTTAGTAGLVDEVPGVVRAPRLEGHYRLWASGPGSTLVEYQIDTELGGRLPRMVLDWAAREVPLRTLLHLRRQVAGVGARYAGVVTGLVHRATATAAAVPGR
jgi:carbon monoxide dehydrogenase subunit G